VEIELQLRLQAQLPNRSKARMSFAGLNFGPIERVRKRKDND